MKEVPQIHMDTHSNAETSSQVAPLTANLSCWAP